MSKQQATMVQVTGLDIEQVVGGCVEDGLILMRKDAAEGGEVGLNEAVTLRRAH